jgi:uncharacterized protein YggE
MNGPNEDAPRPARATIDVRTLVIVIGVAAALLLAYAVGAAGGDSSTQAAADTGSADTADPASGAADTPSIVMTGTGKATPVSDQMTFHVSIHAVRSDVSGAMSTVGTKTTRVLQALRGVGVDPTYVKTTGLSVQPQYDYSGTGPAVISGYTASESLEVAVRELANGGEALAATAAAGGNEVRISGVKLGVSDPDKARAQARKDAIEEASAKAQEYAAAAGRELGDVISVREVMPGTYIPPTPYADTSALRAAAYDAQTTPIPIRAGRSSNSVTVAVVWEFAE